MVQKPDISTWDVSDLELWAKEVIDKSAELKQRVALTGENVSAFADTLGSHDWDNPTWRPVVQGAPSHALLVGN